MSIRHICDCCGKDLGRTLLHYKLVAPISIDNLEICRECFYKIRDEIIKENDKKGYEMSIKEKDKCEE